MFGLRCNYRQLIEHLVDTILTQTAATVLLVPHTFGAESEEDACASLLATLGPRHPHRLFSLAAPLDERELKWVIGQTQFFIGSRMHACIAALSQCVPALGLAYSDKFLGVFQSAGVGDAIIDLRSAGIQTVVDRTLRALDQRASIRGQLELTVPGIRNQVSDAFETLWSRACSR